VTSDATATGGAGPGGAGIALAEATGTAQSATVDAHASTALPAGAHVGSVIADAATGFSDTAGSIATVTANALIGGAAPTFVSTGQAVAIATGAPAAASTNAVLADNPNIAAAVGGSPTFLAEGELGGAYTTGGSGSETTTSSFDITVLLNSADTAQDLVLGLYGGTNVGSGVTSASLNILANGNSTFTGFTSGTDAASHFTDSSVDLGSLSGSAYSSGSLNLEVILKVTADAGSSGFYGGVVVAG
jgi:hypothetical protein